MATWASDVTDGMFWSIVLLAFTMVLWIGTQRFGTPRAFGFAAVSGIFGSIFLATLGLIPWWIGSLFILAGVVGLAALILNER